MRNVAIAFAALLIYSNALAAGPSPYAPKRPGDLQTAVVQISSVPCTTETGFGVRLLAPLAGSKVQVIKRQRAYEQGPFVAEFWPDAAYPPFTEFDLTETMKSEVVWQVYGTAHFHTDELAYEQTLALQAFYETKTGGKWVQRKGFPSPRIGSISVYMPLSGFSIDLSLDRNRLLLTCRSHKGTVDTMREGGLIR